MADLAIMAGTLQMLKDRVRSSRQTLRQHIASQDGLNDGKLEMRVSLCLSRASHNIAIGLLGMNAFDELRYSMFARRILVNGGGCARQCAVLAPIVSPAVPCESCCADTSTWTTQ